MGLVFPCQKKEIKKSWTHEGPRKKNKKEELDTRRSKREREKKNIYTKKREGKKMRETRSESEPAGSA
jgi:hypothetical protein